MRPPRGDEDTLAQALRPNRLARLPAAVWDLLLSPTAGLVAILLFTFALYAPSLNDWFFADDFWFLRHSQTTGWGSWLVQGLDYRDPRPVPEFNEYRPLYLIIFRAEYSLFGLNAAPYHAVNLLIHLSCVAVFWMLALRLTQRVWAAHFAALIFAVHFAYGDAVRWVVNGNTPFAALFYFLAFLLFMNYADGGSKRLWFYGGSLIAFTAALLTHAVTMPLIVAFIAWYFLMQHRPRDALRLSSWLPFVPMLLVLVPYIVIQEWVHQHYANLSIGFQIGWHMYDNFIDYFSISAYPVNLHDGTSPYVSAGVLVFCGFLLTQWRWSPLAVFAVIWYISALAPNSTFILGAQGRLLYLPGAPLALVVATVAMRLVDFASTGKVSAALAPFREMLPALGLAAIVFGALLVWKLQDIASKTAPDIDNTIGKQATANRELIEDLRDGLPSLASSGTLYIVNPPFNLGIFNDDPLDNLVELYYGEVDVKSVPLRDPPFSDEAQVRRALRPQDRIFVFQRDR